MVQQEQAADDSVDAEGPSMVGPVASEFAGVIGRTAGDSTPAMLDEPRPNPGSPNIIYIVLDDAGFADLGCYGAEVETPNIDALAAGGLLYNNFHSKAICSPTRASLLTGRNAHSVGMKELPSGDLGYPHARGRVSASAANVAQLLRQRGYTTLAAGKYHLLPRDQMTATAERTHWPLQKGFDRFYGFLSGWTDQYRPDLVEDNHAIESPDRPDYHFSEDIVDRSIDMLGAGLESDAEKPFFLYLSFGALHAPVQVPKRYIDKYRGAFDAGWDLIREQRYQRQLESGVIPPNTALPPRNPGDSAWVDLTDEERTVYARFMEAYAGFTEHTDDQIGRLLQFLKDNDLWNNTLICLLSDNGGAPEAGPQGNFAHPYRDEMSIHDMYERLDDLGSRDSQPLYQRPWAMASNTPFQYYKLWPFNGGVRTGLIVSWPNEITRPGLRNQFLDVIDITPTVLDIVGIEVPSEFGGVAQMPLHGVTFRPNFDDADRPSDRDTQFFELWGSRSIYHQGWKALAFHTPGTSFDDDLWELYNLNEDYSETTDLAQQHPEKLSELQDLWWSEAERYGALPLLEAPSARSHTYRQILDDAAQRPASR
ncbi:MAG: arylsulfatase [Chloroflexi bacterium]|nr:arylsulfatase [Chloroflexota bacterium]MDA1148251.1 arylsulfatase [Chloroflexota bacterium]